LIGANSIGKTADNRKQSPGDPFDLGDASAYGRWRKEKLASYPRQAPELVVPIAQPATPATAEKVRILNLCRRANMAVFEMPQAGAGVTTGDLRNFLQQFGLIRPETHRSADNDGMFAIEVAKDGHRHNYIPYTDRALNWHTDGYYVDPSTPIRAMALYCVRNARSGGGNSLLDPEIAYIRMRDDDPAHIRALMHPQAMTIPENRESDGTLRPQITGPVFSIDPVSSRLHMRFTARSRNIVWRDDNATQSAVRFLLNMLDGGEPLILHHRLTPGQGLICNNVLHSRSSFTDTESGGRLLYRARYYERVAGSGMT
jgi:alpha-ketoglutarate-dependent taurine dioxygenase